MGVLIGGSEGRCGAHRAGSRGLGVALRVRLHPSAEPKTKKKERDAPNAFSQARVKNFARVSPSFCTYFYTGSGTGQGFFFSTSHRQHGSHARCHRIKFEMLGRGGGVAPPPRRRKRSEKGSHLHLTPAGRSAARLGATPAVKAIGQRDLLGSSLLNHGGCPHGTRIKK